MTDRLSRQFTKFV